MIETTAVRVMRLAEVDLAHALGEGEGYRSVADWRAGHERFWHSADMRNALSDPEFTVSDDTLVVAQDVPPGREPGAALAGPGRSTGVTPCRRRA